MQTEPNFDYERKNVFLWTPFDYLHWLRNIQDDEEMMGNEKTMAFIKQIADGLFNKIDSDRTEVY